ncbi:MAG: PilT/PilU family type 4a pilus ATPase [Rhodothermales bacterium]|nr:PilT/PilU family type 4a pilus ATPase [Rhodothermales bacterium]
MESPDVNLQHTPQHGRINRQASARAEADAVVAGLPAFAKEIASRTPFQLMGDDRVRHQIELIDAMDSRQRAALRLHYDVIARRMLTLSASDVDLGGAASKGRIWYRVDGEKTPDKTMPEYSQDETNLLILNLLTTNGRKSLLDWYAADFSYELSGSNGKRRRFRATAYMDMGHLALNMRAIGDEVRSIKSLEFHPKVERGLMFRHVRDGLTLITGVTGSGKSTTMDAIVDANNADVQGHIVIVGKPIEYMHQSKKSIVRHREVGQDVATFKDAIVQALRQDPDIIVVGEMRDPETISAALEITDSGHKVFSTLHTSSAVESIDRIIGEYPSEEQNRIRYRLADTLRCIVSQKLLPKVGGGRVLAKEVLWMTPPSRAAIKNDNAGEIYQMMWEGWNNGMITLEQDLYRLVRKGLITKDSAMDNANNKRRLQQLIR